MSDTSSEETDMQEDAKASDSQVLIALVTLVELLMLGGIAIGYMLTRGAIWIHMGVVVLVVAGALVVLLSWRESQAKKKGGGDA